MRQLEAIQNQLRALSGELGARYKARIVGVFGSYARGEARSDSDLDILVEFERGASLLDVAGLQVELSERLGIPVDIVPREDVRPAFRDRIEAEVIPL